MLQGAATALLLANAPAPASSELHGQHSPAAVQPSSATGFGYLTQLRRETTRRLAGELGDARLREQREQGATMDTDEAVSYALSAANTVTVSR